MVSMCIRMLSSEAILCLVRFHMKILLINTLCQLVELVFNFIVQLHGCTAARCTPGPMKAWHGITIIIIMIIENTVSHAIVWPSDAHKRYI